MAYYSGSNPVVDKKYFRWYVIKQSTSDNSARLLRALRRVYRYRYSFEKNGVPKRYLDRLK